MPGASRKKLTEQVPFRALDERATQREARLLGLMSADPEARIHLHVCQCLEEQGIDPNADSERPNSAGVGFELSQDIQDAHLSVLVEIVEGLGENLTEKQTRLRRLVLKAVQHG